MFRRELDMVGVITGLMEQRPLRNLGYPLARTLSPSIAGTDLSGERRRHVEPMSCDHLASV
jgi:hypothetical protein